MRCNKCGNIVEDINEYCDECGAKIIKKSNPIKLILILLGEFILTLSLILSIIFIVKNSIKDLSPEKFTENLVKYNFKVEDITKKYAEEKDLNKYLIVKDEKNDIYFHYVLLDKKQNEMFYTLKQKSNNAFNNFIEAGINFNKYKYYSIENKENYSVVIRNNNALLWIGGDIKNKEKVKKIITDLNMVYPSIVNFLVILYLLLLFIMIKIVEWNIFVKGGKKGWYVFIPLYHYYILAKTAFGYGWNFIFLYIPLINIIYIPFLLYKISRSFGKSVLFSILNIIFPFINMQIIAFDNSKYTKYKDIEDESEEKIIKNENELSGELIVYNKKKNDEFSFITEEKVDTYNNINKAMYEKISKSQKRSSILICISIFLYFLSLSLLVLFSDLEEDEFLTTLILPLILIIFATVLLIISKVIKKKNGRIKYKYKNESYLFISMILFGINAFLINEGLTVFNIDITMESALFIAELGISISCLVYYFKSCGKKGKKLRKWIKIVLFILSIITGFCISFLVRDEEKLSNNLILDYSKTTNLIYEQTDRAVAFYKSDKLWYTFTNKYNTNHFEFSVSESPENLNIVYETNNVNIINLSGNDDYATWCEVSSENVGYYYYDVSENQVYELLTIPYTKNAKQIFNINLYKDNIYYEIIDYNEKQVIVMEYNITSNKNKTIYTIKDIDDTDLGKNSFNISDSNLLLTTFIKNIPTIIKLDLNKQDNDSYKTNILTLNNNISNIYTSSIKNNKLILYYNKNGSDKIDIIDNKGNIIQHIYTFTNSEYVSFDDIYLKDNILYYIKVDEKVSINKMSDREKLIIYDLENNKKQEIKGIFDYCITKKNIYGLGTYKNNLNNVRLYEIWN